MARFLDRRRHNPDIKLLGIDVVDAALVGVGLTISAFIDDKLVAPIAKSVAGFAYKDQATAKIADGLTTFGTAAAVGYVADAIFDREVGAFMALGGGAVGFARAASAVVPDWQISAAVPHQINFLGSQAGKGTPANVTQPTSLQLGGPGAQSVSTYAAGATYASPEPIGIGTQTYSLQGGI